MIRSRLSCLAWEPLSIKFAGGLLAIGVFLVNAWLADDAYIYFRSLEQLYAGNGPRWNPHERVMAFTSPLWFWLLAAARSLTTDVALATYGVSAVLWLCCVVTVGRKFSSWPAFLLCIMLMLVSSSIVDFTTSGLENILAFALLLLWVTAIYGDDATKRSSDFALGLAGLVLVTRHDLALLVTPVCLFLIYRAYRLGGGRSLVYGLALFAGPLALWSVISTIYYGFPFPNTAYAKLGSGVPQSQLWIHGLMYLRMLGAHDLLGLLLVLFGVATVVVRTLPVEVRLVGLGIALHAFYVVSIGGDFMRGRFFSYGALLGAVTLTWMLRSRPWVLATSCLAIGVYGFTYPDSPLLTRVTEQEDLRQRRLGIGDEQAYYYPYTSIAAYVEYVTELRQGHEGLFPNASWSYEGWQHRVSDQPVRIAYMIGMSGYWAGTEKIYIDSFALADPFLARQPAFPLSDIGHFLRDVPDWYFAQLSGEKVDIIDPIKQGKADQIAAITQSDSLWSRSRLIEVFNANLEDLLH